MRLLSGRTKLPTAGPLQDCTNYINYRLVNLKFIEEGAYVSKMKASPKKIKMMPKVSNSKVTKVKVPMSKVVKVKKVPVSQAVKFKKLVGFGGNNLNYLKQKLKRGEGEASVCDHQSCFSRLCC